VVFDESHNLSNSATQNNRLARLLAANSEALILASATPHNGRADSFAQLIRLLDPSAVRTAPWLSRRSAGWSSGGTGTARKCRRWSVRTGPNGLEPRDILITPTPAEDAIAHELERTWLFPPGGP